MAGPRLLYGGADAGASAALNGVLFQNQRVPCCGPSLGSIFMSGSSSFMGSRSMVSFEDVNGRNKSERSFFRSFDPDDNGDEELDGYFYQSEKKRRLTADQVQFLEKSFEAENKLEPERKVQLAKELGLQPRQIAIWFQNRRARWKTKQIEKDYEALQDRYNGLKSDYDHLVKEKDELKNQVVNLTEKLKQKEKIKGGLAGIKRPFEAPTEENKVDSNCESKASKVSVVACKQEDLSSAKSDLVDLDSPHYTCESEASKVSVVAEDLSSAKSDVVDSDSPHYTDGVHSSFLEPGDSSYVFEPDHSDPSQDEEDNLSKILLPPAYMFPKFEDAHYPHPPASSCYFVFPAEDQTFDFWSSY